MRQPIKVFELFAGIGAFRQALKNQNIDHKVVAFSEIDKYAIGAYRAIHDDYETPNLGDIKEITHLPPCDLLTYGFPCQDISIAGYGKGIKENTRSGLLLEVERLLDTSAIIGNLPKVLILENVKALIQKKHKPDFDSWIEKLESLGYTNYWQVLNAKDYGIPQNRERVFVISILGEHKPYEFPEKQELKLRLRDLLDNEVPENYYLKDEKVEEFISRLGKQGYILRNEIAGAVVSGQIRNNLVLPTLTPDRLEKRQNGRRFKNNDDPSFTLTAQDRHGVTLIGSLTDKNSQGERVYTTDIAVTQNANGGGLGAKTGLYLIGNVNPSEKGQNGQVFSSSGLSPTLTTNKGEGIKVLIDKDVSNCITANIGKGADLKGYVEKTRKQLVTDCTLRIRRLTPNECWRLMGFTDEAYQKARLALNNKFYKGKDRANSQMYKQAGNSIAVPVLEPIIKNLYRQECKS
ncbi:DNA (cytosine-5-)-methyltransferase [Sebaldella sp. S0638]|uniref:DNA (cytosine-5-)-methyltransferase n=1 Tax=Sebaldella sp. S0638 TaxID=2957809 RepID=UPI0020A15CFA|nr:DNA (cytosine-5-)-methyltransferase [Sebaldella sp. S0638]